MNPTPNQIRGLGVMGVVGGVLLAVLGRDADLGGTPLPAIGAVLGVAGLVLAVRPRLLL